jgi:predicted short-subunit dehydrogenase-like oxidoreductase (DUF2520 family)
MENFMKTISIIGAGKLGKTIAFLFNKKSIFEINEIFCNSFESSRKAVSFIGSGLVVSKLDDLRESDIFLISTPDDKIEKISEKIINKYPNSIFFHCSGSLSSNILRTKKSCSIHPVHSFADPNKSIEIFEGTMCGVEGNKEALDILIPAFKKIGAKVFEIDSDKKALYHSATVVACNYFVVMEYIAEKLLLESGVKKEDIIPILAPILKGTLSNIIEKGTVRSLTGPVSRGDTEVILKHIESLESYDKKIALIYKLLCEQAVEITKNQGSYLEEDLKKILDMIKK